MPLAASSPKPGKRAASIRPRSSISVVVGSSSNSTTTIGAWVTPPIVRAWASSGKASFEIGSVKRNSARNTSGTGESTRRNERTGSAAAYRVATPEPIASDATIMTGSGRSTVFLIAWAAISATRIEISTRCAPSRAVGPASPTSSSIPNIKSGGSTTSTTEKLMMSKPDEPRAAKNSGLSFSRSKSGWATAKVQRTARPR